MLLERLLRSQVITTGQIEVLRAELGAEANDEVLVDALVRRGLVTAWQRDQVRKGDAVFFLDDGRYLLLSQIGQGGMGAVYRARHTRMNRDVAIKVIDPRRVKDQRLVDRFRREVAVSSRLQHEHIVHAHDVGQQGGVSFLVLEYVEGSDLASLVRRDGPMEPAEAAAICMQAASGLAYAHGQNVVHRDIKPQNILLSTGGATRILDMGLARIVAEAEEDSHTALTQEGAVMGTIDFMAPEQALNTHAADGRSDIYSLGATLYYLLTGRKPFPGGSAAEKLVRLAQEEPQPVGQLRPDCPRALTDVVERMMAKRPQERFQTAEDVVRQLQPLAAEKIAGRPVVTASVQSAAETHRSTGLEVTLVTGPVFQPDAGTVVGMLRRRQNPPRRGVWLLRGSIAVPVLLLLGALWYFGRPAAERSRIPDLKPPPVANQTSVPPTEYRIELDGHFGAVAPGDWSPDGSFLATRGGDGQVQVWTADGKRTVAIYRGHTANVRHLTFSPDGSRIASTDVRGTIHVWNAFSGKQVARLERPKAFSGDISHIPEGAAFSADGREIAFFDGDKIVRYNVEKDRRVWRAHCSLPANS
ncbi:MAG: protein kinase [Planctomycetes bacterium]|nr:protein kinase [Planctomycetota bacterium]